MNCSMPGLPVYHQLPEFTQTHVHWVGDDIQPYFIINTLVFALSEMEGCGRVVKEKWHDLTFTLKGYLGLLCGQSIAGTIAIIQRNNDDGSDRFGRGVGGEKLASVPTLEVEHKGISRWMKMWEDETVKSTWVSRKMVFPLSAEMRTMDGGSGLRKEIQSSLWDY